MLSIIIDRDLAMSKETVRERRVIKKPSNIVLNITLMPVILYILATSVAAALASSTSAQDTDLTLSIKEQKSLIYLLKQDCGSCHGLTLQGGLGPALLQQNLQHKPQEYIESVIAYGRAGTAMPPWKDILNEKEIRFLAIYLLSNENKLAKQDKVAQPQFNSQVK
jgi:cytochrome c55X